MRTRAIRDARRKVLGAARRNQHGHSTAEEGCDFNAPSKEFAMSMGPEAARNNSPNGARQVESGFHNP